VPLLRAEPFTVPADSDFGGTALEVLPQEQPFDAALAGLIDTRFAKTEVREQVTVGGHRGFRLELVATGEGLADRARAHTGTSFAATAAGRSSSRRRHSRARRSATGPVVDHAASTIAFFEPAPVAVSGLPEPVAQTHAAVLAAAEAHDEQALEALIEPSEFRYTFGEDVPGGALAFWRTTKEQTGTDPIDTLARVLKLPYVLSQGLFVWPFAYDKEPGEMSEYELSLLGDLMPEGVTRSATSVGARGSAPTAAGSSSSPGTEKAVGRVVVHETDSLHQRVTAPSARRTGSRAASAPSTSPSTPPSPRGSRSSSSSG
jgi:hypothetical protein